MSFSEQFSANAIVALKGRIEHTTYQDVQAILRKGRATSIEEFAQLLSPAASELLEEMAALSHTLTTATFGRVMRMFAPLYLSNECVNICKYCGFSRNNPIPRITLPIVEVEAETDLLMKQGFRSILLVAGEHPKYVSNGYVEAVCKRLLPKVPGISLELGPMETEDYIPLVAAGAENLVVYQETYHEVTYKEMHPAGPKRRYGWRMDTPERAYAAGFRRLGIGALIGLYDWQYEILSLAAHADYLRRRCWKAFLSISLPRMRPAAGEFTPRDTLPDRSFVQVITALRLFLPHVGLVLSTREPGWLRDGLIPLGITHMSAGSCTEPGGYQHYNEETWTAEQEQPGEQFHISDERSPREIAQVLESKGYEPVWKDFDQALVADAHDPDPQSATSRVPFIPKAELAHV
jgi:2-iminoacetate synthase